MKVRLTKLSKNENKLRTPSVEGELVQGPELQKSLVLVGVGLTPGMPYRQVETSIIQEIKVLAPKMYELKTLNSTYHLELLEAEV